MSEFSLRDVDGLVERMKADVEGFLEEERDIRLRLTLRKTQDLSPLDTGEHRASWTPWGVGGPGISASRAQGHTTPASPQEATAALAGLPIGADFGVATSDPAGVPLVSGSSPKAKPAFPLQAAKTAVREAPRRVRSGS